MTNAQFHATRIVNGIRALIAVFCIGYIVVDGGPKLYGAFMAHVYTTQIATATPQWKIDDMRENTYRTVCKVYDEATFSEKWLSYHHLRWCQDYLHRL